MSLDLSGKSTFQRISSHQQFELFSSLSAPVIKHSVSSSSLDTCDDSAMMKPATGTVLIADAVDALAPSISQVCQHASHHIIITIASKLCAPFPLPQTTQAAFLGAIKQRHEDQPRADGEAPDINELFRFWKPTYVRKTKKMRVSPKADPAAPAKQLTPQQHDVLYGLVRLSTFMAMVPRSPLLR